MIAAASAPSVAPAAGYCSIAGKYAAGRHHDPRRNVPEPGRTGSPPPVSTRARRSAYYLEGLGISCVVPAGYARTDEFVGSYGHGDPGRVPATTARHHKQTSAQHQITCGTNWLTGFDRSSDQAENRPAHQRPDHDPADARRCLAGQLRPRRAAGGLPRPHVRAGRPRSAERLSPHERPGRSRGLGAKPVELDPSRLRLSTSREECLPRRCASSSPRLFAFADAAVRFVTPSFR